MPRLFALSGRFRPDEMTPVCVAANVFHRNRISGGPPKNHSYDYDLDVKPKTISTIRFQNQKRKVLSRFRFGTKNESYDYDFVSEPNPASRNTFSGRPPKNRFLLPVFTGTFTKGQVTGLQNGVFGGFVGILPTAEGIS